MEGSVEELPSEGAFSRTVASNSDKGKRVPIHLLPEVEETISSLKKSKIGSNFEIGKM